MKINSTSLPNGQNLKQPPVPNSGTKSLERKEKHILIRCHDLATQRPDFRSQQIELWIVFRDGKQSTHLGPTIICSHNLDHAIAECLDSLDAVEAALTAEEHGNALTGNESSAPVDYSEPRRYHHDRLAYLQRIQHQLASGDKFIISDAPEKKSPGCPEIFIQGDFLSQALIEAGLAFYLREKGYLEPNTVPKFYWHQKETGNAEKE